MAETHPNALKLEAQEKREQAAQLLAEAEALDPTPKSAPKRAKSPAKKKKPVKK